MESFKTFVEVKKQEVNKDRLEQAKKLGYAAAKAGKMAAPVLDKELMKMIGSNPVGNSDTISIMKAWNAGWTKYNLED